MISKMRFEADHPECFSERKRYELDRHVIRIMCRTGKISTQCFGLENLPEEGGYVMCPNHQGKYDALAIMLCHDEPCSVVMDIKKSKSILVREFIDLVQGKRLDKSDVRQALTIIKEIAEEVRSGRRYIIFPEGGYENNNNNLLGEFKPGSFKCATLAKAPIVPVALVDSYKVFNSSYFKPVNVQVHFLPPIFYEEYQNLRTQDIAVLVKQRIAEKIYKILSWLC